MPKRRWIQDPRTFELVEVTEDYEFPSLPNDSGALWGDRQYANLRATDGTDISSRTKHREYMRQHGLTTADDFRESWRSAHAAREAYFRGEDSTRREDVERAIHHLEKG